MITVLILSCKKCRKKKVCDPKDLHSLIVETERQRCIDIVRQYIAFESQRAVSWHEVRDTLDAMVEEPVATMPDCPSCGQPVTIEQKAFKNERLIPKSEW